MKFASRAARRRVRSPPRLLDYVFALWADQWQRWHARGVVILTRFADDYIVGFEHRDDVERFLADLRERFATFALKRITSKKRMRTKLSEVKAELMRRRHLPIPEQGRWLASVLRGRANYYAVPSNSDAIIAFRSQVTRHWRHVLTRRASALAWTGNG